MRIFLLIASMAAALAQTPSLDFRGDRFKPLTYQELSPEQKAVADLVLSGKIQGGTGGPLNTLLRSPILAESIARYGEYERFRVPIPEKLKELAVLVTTRYWTAQFPWYAHHRAATQAGLKEPIAQAIAEGRRPAGMNADETLVYNFTRELLKTTAVSDATFNAMKQRFTERGVVEFIGLMGYYGIVAMAVNTDRYPLPAGVAAELKPLANPLP